MGGRAARRGCEACRPDRRRAAGLRALRRGAARAPARPRARGGAELRPAAQDPRPRARRGRRAPMDDEGLDPDALEAELRASQRAALLPLHDPDVPEPERAVAFDRAAPADRRDRRGPPARRARGRPVRPRPLRGRCSAEPSRARGRRARLVHVLVLEDRRTGLRTGYFVLPADTARVVRGARGVDLHLATLPRAGDRCRAHRPRALRAEPRARLRGAACATRRHARPPSSGRSHRALPGAGPRAVTSSGSSLRTA